MRYFYKKLRMATPFMFLTSLAMGAETANECIVQFHNNVAQGQVTFEYRIQRGYTSSATGDISSTMTTHTDSYAPWATYSFLKSDFENPNYPLHNGDCIYLNKLIFKYQENEYDVTRTFTYLHQPFVLGTGGSTRWHNLTGDSKNDCTSFFKWDSRSINPAVQAERDRIRREEQAERDRVRREEQAERDRIQQENIRRAYEQAQNLRRAQEQAAENLRRAYEQAQNARRAYEQAQNARRNNAHNNPKVYPQPQNNAPYFSIAQVVNIGRDATLTQNYVGFDLRPNEDYRAAAHLLRLQGQNLTKALINRAYLRGTRNYHPDQNRGNPAAGEAFQYFSEAKKILDEYLDSQGENVVIN